MTQSAISYYNLTGVKLLQYTTLKQGAIGKDFTVSIGHQPGVTSQVYYTIVYL